MMLSSAKAHRRGFLSGVSVLTLSTLLVKVIGLLYRIPLLDKLGTEGMGYFNTAYELYALFCVISTAGLPVAMSVLISAREAAGNYAAMRCVYRVSLLAFVVIGACGSLLLFGMASPFAALLGNPNAAACMRAISPTVLLICLSSAARGYFQGRRNMLPTAISQIMEAAGKLFLGLAFAAYAHRSGMDLPHTAAYAVGGLTVGTGVSVLYLFTHKALSDRRERFLPTNSGEAEDSRASVLRRLAVTAVPVTLGAGVISLTKCIDLALILHRLQGVGVNTAEANALYGCYSTLAVPVFNMLPSLTTSVALSAVPSLSAALERGEAGRADVKRTATAALGLTLVLAIPAALGLAVYAEEILLLLFNGQPAAAAQAAPWLSCLALSVPAACLVTVTGAMLQACGRAACPVLSMLAGVVTKTVLAYVLLGTEGVGMMGAPISSLLCDTVIVTVNFLFISRYAPAMLPDRRVGVIAPTILIALSAMAVWVVNTVRATVTDGPMTPVGTMMSIAAVALLYGACIWIAAATLRSAWKPKKLKEG